MTAKVIKFPKEPVEYTTHMGITAPVLTVAEIHDVVDDRLREVAGWMHRTLDLGGKEAGIEVLTEVGDFHRWAEVMFGGLTDAKDFRARKRVMRRAVSEVDHFRERMIARVRLLFSSRAKSV
jgi:hypothetical protein